MNSPLGPLAFVKLTSLMQLTRGRADTVIGVIDGPLAIDHLDLAGAHVRELPAALNGTCTRAGSAACMHGTFVAGVLVAKRGSLAPAICPDCTLLLRPVFSETTPSNGDVPSATPEELAAAIVDCIDAGARVLNLSVALSRPSSKGERELEDALDYAMKRGVLVVAAAGNQGTVGSSAITRHRSVIPVVAYDVRGAPMGQSNLGSSIGRRGVGAPGDRITSLGAAGTPMTLGGTSVAAPFVTGAIALLWSAFPTATAGEVRSAVTQTNGSRRTTIVPPLLDAWAAYQALATTSERR